MKLFYRTLLLAVVLVAGTVSAVAGGPRVKEINHKEYSKLFESGKKIKKPAVIFFYKSDSEACQKFAPLLEELASKNFKGKINFYCIDVDANPQLTGQLGINAIPYLACYPKTNKGEPFATKGAQSKQAYINLFNEKLLNKKPKKK